MAFVNEEIPEEEKTKHDFHLLVDPFTKSSFRPWKWTIDHQRNIFLVCIGGGVSHLKVPLFFAMKYKNEYIRADLFKVQIISEECGSKITYKVDSLDIPEKLTKDREKIIQLLEEALTVYGLIYEQFDMKSAHLEFKR